MKSNLIAAKDISTDQLSPHHFNIQQKVEEDSISHLLRNMYELEFSERHTNTDLEYSIVDKRFLALMDSKVKMVDGSHSISQHHRKDQLPSKQQRSSEKKNARTEEKTNSQPKYLRRLQSFYVKTLRKEIRTKGHVGR